MQLDPAGADRYLTGHTEFAETFRAAIKRWRTKAAPLESTAIITHHRSYSYLANWLGLEVIETIEPKPGISPSSSHLAKLLQLIELRQPTYILVTPYSDPKPASWLAERTNLPVIQLPYTVGREHSAATLFELFDITINLLLDQS
jgi:zinc/manganese transport system substrate-binding protein